VEPWTLELSAYGFGGTASRMLRSTSLDRSHYQIPGAMGCSRQECWTRGQGYISAAATPVRGSDK
jgi:hypothetical protein